MCPEAVEDVEGNIGDFEKAVARAEQLSRAAMAAAERSTKTAMGAAPPIDEISRLHLGSRPAGRSR